MPVHLLRLHRHLRSAQGLQSDLAAPERSSRCSPPDLILPRAEPNEAILSRHRHFPALDRFHHHWKDSGGTLPSPAP
jgi:hypothetical protein